MTKYKWAHINDRGYVEVSLMLPGAEVISDGDCGSVWGEYHESNHCPYPHVLVKNPTLKEIQTLKENGVRFYADPTEVWGEDRAHALDWRWTEDGYCDQRTLFDRDYRHPYGEADTRPAELSS